LGEQVERSSEARPLVVDLSSLWAGPLAGSLLALAGARVIKVESLERPDGARRGSPDFFSLLNGAKQSVVLEFRSERGIAQLRAMLARADLVIESSRPRALAQLGISAERVVAETPGLTWLGISGYGRREPGARWVAFGDDAGIAAGLAGGGPDAPLFCGDAVADPLAGLHAAVAALASFRRGGGELVDVSLHDVAAHVLGTGSPRDAQLRERSGEWCVETPEGRAPVAEPRARVVTRHAPALGADSESVLAEFATRC
jgi:crotonobetainyl-CoA:carnitine CoA-transferase CaiB-like acyl-CoA transferase